MSHHWSKLTRVETMRLASLLLIALGAFLWILAAENRLICNWQLLPVGLVFFTLSVLLGSWDARSRDLRRARR